MSPVWCSLVPHGAVGQELPYENDNAIDESRAKLQIRRSVRSLTHAAVHVVRPACAITKLHEKHRLVPATNLRSQAAGCDNTKRL